MPTPAERKALLFLATVVALGAGVRGVRAARGASPPDPAAERALANQIQAVDSARAVAPRRGRARTTLPEPRTGLTPGLSVRASRAPRATSKKGQPEAPVPDARPIDLDRASAAEIEALPRIGPALARRIVADRDSLGAFGSLAELQRVRGIGPAMAKALEGRVTFSGTARPSNAVAGPRVTSPSPSRKSHRRTPRP